MNLSDLKPGQKAQVSALHLEGAVYRRLLDIGLIKDTAIECVGISPCGDPKAYLIRGAVIALRGNETEKIKVELYGK